jgi:general secretion pathway protein L
MAEFFVIRFGEQPNDPVEWIAVDDMGTRRSAVGQGQLGDAAIESAGRPVIVLVPGTEVLSAFTAIPAKGARLLAALPYALEDQLADDIDNLHFAAGKRDENGRLPVAVVARARMDEWLEALQTAGLKAQRLVPDNHGLARVPNTLSMLVADDRIMFNDGDETEFVLPELGPADALAASGLLDAPADDEAGVRPLLVYCDAALGDQYERDWALLRHELDEVSLNLLPDGALPKLAVTIAAGAGINLLQGAYGDKTRISTSLQPWRYAAMLLVALVFVGLLAKGVDYYRLSVERDALQAQFTEEYRQLRPGDTRDIADPAGTINSLRRGQNAAAAGPQSFLPLIASLAAAIDGNSDIRVEAISYRAGVVDVRLNAPDIPTLDGIVQSVKTTGRFTASLQSADNVDERVNSRIQIREAGS